MTTTLKVSYAGSTPGLENHRLSVSHFGEPLNKLVAALRRIASNMISQATEEVGATGGRLAKNAQAIDVEIAAIEPGSVGLALVVVARLAGGQGELFDNLPDRACADFVSCVESEAQGRTRSAVVRKYLQSLPSGLARQQYQLTRSDGSRIETSIEAVEIAKIPAVPPSLDEIEGSIIGVGFEPGRWEVRIMDSMTRNPVSCLASSKLVEDAIALRSKRIRVLTVSNGARVRLLRLQDADAPPIQLTEAQRHELVFGRWDELMRRLAE
jgi:hypothetical protein